MGTTIQETSNLKYTDSSGVWREGMKRDEAKDIRPWKVGIFTEGKALKRFDEKDKDNDGILSKDEISDEIRKDISNAEIGSKICACGVSAGVAATLASATTKNKKVAKASVIVNAILLLIQGYNIYNLLTLNKRLGQGHN